MDEASMKVILTLAIIGFAAAVGAIGAKLMANWYGKREVKKDESKLDAQAKSIVRARLAVMQFKRHRMGVGEKKPTNEELSKRRNLGIWSYKGGTSLGPMYPGKKPSIKKPKSETGEAARKSFQRSSTTLTSTAVSNEDCEKGETSSHHTEDISGKSEAPDANVPMEEGPSSSTAVLEMVTEKNIALPISSSSREGSPSKMGGGSSALNTCRSLSTTTSRNSQDFGAAVPSEPPSGSSSPEGKRRLFQRVTPNEAMMRQDAAKSPTKAITDRGGTHSSAKTQRPKTTAQPSRAMSAAAGAGARPLGKTVSVTHLNTPESKAPGTSEPKATKPRAVAAKAADIAKRKPASGSKERNRNNPV